MVAILMHGGGVTDIPDYVILGAGHHVIARLMTCHILLSVRTLDMSKRGFIGLCDLFVCILQLSYCVALASGVSALDLLARPANGHRAWFAH